MKEKVNWLMLIGLLTLTSCEKEATVYVAFVFSLTAAYFVGIVVILLVKGIYDKSKK